MAESDPTRTPATTTQTMVQVACSVIALKAMEMARRVDPAMAVVSS